MTKTRTKKRSSLPWLLLMMTLAAVVVAGYVIYQRYQRFADFPLPLPANEQTLTVEPGDSFADVLRKLRKTGVSQGHDMEWKALATEMRVISRLQVGEYAFGNGITPRQLLAKFERGDVLHYRLTIIEGWNFSQLRAALSSNNDLKKTIAQLSDQELMAKLGKPGVHPEGRFLPETYHFTRSMTDLGLLERAMKAMDQALQEAWEARNKDAPLKTPEELLTLASIIEKETGKADERPQIGGVFARRLKLGMRLQTDPTVIYGLGSAFDGNLRRVDLDTDTPYNTYTRAGLPPTPIALPGVAALKAAANPADGDALYFVSRGDGSHVFSATYAEHNAAVRKYQLKQ